MGEKEPVFLSVKELAKYLKVSPDWVYTRVGLGEIPHSRVGRLIRFEVAEIERWKKRQRAVVAS